MSDSTPTFDRLTELRRQRADLDAEIRAAEELPPVAIPPLIRLAQETFAADLPQLLLERPGQWVAYRGADRVGFATTGQELYLQCATRGYDPDEYVVRCIEPECVAVVGVLDEVSTTEV